MKIVNKLLRRNGSKVISKVIGNFSSFKDELTSGIELCKDHVDESQQTINKEQEKIQEHTQSASKAQKVIDNINKFLGV